MPENTNVVPRGMLAEMVARLTKQSAEDPGTSHPAKAEETGAYPEGTASSEMSADVKKNSPQSVEDGNAKATGGDNTPPGNTTATELGADPTCERDVNAPIEDVSTTHPAKAAELAKAAEFINEEIEKLANEITEENAISVLGKLLAPEADAAGQTKAAEAALQAEFSEFSKAASCTAELVVDEARHWSACVKVADELGVTPETGAQVIDAGHASPEDGSLNAASPEEEELLAAIAQFAEKQGVPLEQVIQAIESGQLSIEDILGGAPGAEGAEGEGAPAGEPAPTGEDPAEAGEPAAPADVDPEKEAMAKELGALQAKLADAEKKAAAYDLAMSEFTAEAQLNDMASRIASRLKTGAK